LHAGVLPTSRRLSSLRDPRHVVLRRGPPPRLSGRPRPPTRPDAGRTATDPRA
jgi:hypothetical protein